MIGTSSARNLLPWDWLEVVTTAWIYWVNNYSLKEKNIRKELCPEWAICDETINCIPQKNRFGSEGLKLVGHSEIISFGRSVLKLTFDPGKSQDGKLTVECRLDHPFYVKNKGQKHT